MISQNKAKTLLAKATHDKLTRLLQACYCAKSNREVEQTHEKLRLYLGTLFSYRDVCEFHNEQLEDLAENIQGLYPERDDLEDYTFHILAYLRKRIKDHHQQEEKVLMLLNIKRKQGVDSLGYLDAKYQAWVYTHGYQAQQMLLYKLLYDQLDGLHEVVIKSSRKRSDMRCLKNQKTNG